MAESKGFQAGPFAAVCIALLSAVSGFLAGTASFSGRIATLEVEYRQVQEIKDDVKAMRGDVSRIAAKVGIAPVASASLTKEFTVYAAGLKRSVIAQLQAR